MKKISFVLVAMMFLAGCGAIPTAATTKPASEAGFTGTSTDNVTTQTATVETSGSAAVTIPSFADGDIYLDAIAEKDPSKCSTIKDAKLKKDCATAAGAK